MICGLNLVQSQNSVNIRRIYLGVTRISAKLPEVALHQIPEHSEYAG